MDSVKTAHAKTRRAYDLAAAKYHELFHDEMSGKAYDRLLLDSFAGRLPAGALVCDAGCGPSAHTGRYLADKGLAVVGVDISDRCVEMARAVNPQMRFVREDMLRLSFADEAFEGYVQELLGIQAEIYFSLFDEKEIGGYLEEAGFAAEFLERRNPYDFEIKNERIFAIGRKVSGKGVHM